MPSLFPESSKTGGDTAADPKIWSSMEDFKARFAKFGADAKEADGKVTDLDSFKALFGSIGKNDCGGCHEHYQRQEEARIRRAESPRHRMTRRLRVFGWAVAAVVAVGAALVLWAVTIPATVPASALPPHTPDLDNGRTMFDIGGCASCHATPNHDPAKVERTRLGGGLALKSPFGTFYVPNISPDPTDGIGAWSEADFVTALWKGTSPRGRASASRRSPTLPIST